MSAKESTVTPAQRDANGPRIGPDGQNGSNLDPASPANGSTIEPVSPANGDQREGK